MQKRSLAAVCATGFAFSANFTNHAPMVAALRAEFGFNQASAGLLTTGVFLTHALMQVPAGRMADRLGPGKVLAAGLAWVSLGNFAIAFAHAYWQLLFWKVFVGMGTGASYAAGARYVVSIFSGRERNIAQGCFGGSIVLGSGFVILAVPQLLGSFGWRGAFLQSAAVAVIVWILWMLFADRPQHLVAAAGKFADMIDSRELWLLGLAQMASFGLVIVVGTWITTLLRTSFQIPLKQAGLLGSLVLLLGIVTRPAGGWLIQRMPPLTLLRAALFLNAIACAVLAFDQSMILTMLAITALGLGCGLPYAAIFGRAAARFPAGAGAAIGFVNAVGILMILAGAPAVGYVADWTGHFRSSFLALSAFCILAAATSLLLAPSTSKAN